MEPHMTVLSVVSVPGGRGYYAPVVYEARARKDGEQTFRAVEYPLGNYHFQGHSMRVGYRSQQKAERHARELAEARGLPFVAGVRHGRLLSAVKAVTSN